jgi:hypothetical protein
MGKVCRSGIKVCRDNAVPCCVKDGDRWVTELGNEPAGYGYDWKDEALACRNT